MSDVLADTAVWVAFFRGERRAVAALDPLLAEGHLAICGPIYAELLSGALTRAVFSDLRDRLRSLPWLPEPRDLWDRAGEARFALARQGIQASLVDLHIAMAASDGGHRLLTKDGEFAWIGRVIPLEVTVLAS